MLERKIKLINDLKTDLENCDEMWIATAMISDNGFKYIQNYTNGWAKQNYLIGINLPTSPEVLRLLKDLNHQKLIKSKICQRTDKLFHPNAYIFRNNDKLIAYVGSGSCIDGGLDKIIELTIKIECQEFCETLIEWFKNLYRFSNEITEEFLVAYEALFPNRIKRICEDEIELKNIFKDRNFILNLNEIDFRDQFFTKEHFEIFTGRKPWDESPEIVADRENVYKRFYKLDRELMPLINEKKWNLRKHFSTKHVISSPSQSSSTAANISAVCLYYGQGVDELEKSRDNWNLLENMCMQVIISQNKIGICNRIGKDKGSRIDRENLKLNLKNCPNYRIQMFSAIEAMPDNYFIELNNERRAVRDFANESQLSSYLLQADFYFYFAIGMEMNPGDRRLSKKNICKTIMENFELLYPTYKLIQQEFK